MKKPKNLTERLVDLEFLQKRGYKSIDLRPPKKLKNKSKKSGSPGEIKICKIITTTKDNFIHEYHIITGYYSQNGKVRTQREISDEYPTAKFLKERFDGFKA